MAISGLDIYKDKYHFAMNFYSLFLVATFIPDIVGINNILFKNLFWVLRILLALWIIISEQKTAFYFTALQKLYLFVALLYALNIYADVFLAPLPNVLSHTNGLLDLIIFCVGIVLALSFRYYASISTKKSFDFFWITLTIGLLLAFHFARLTPNILLFDEDSQRYDANSTVNTIIYGQCGCALCIASAYGFLNFKRKLFFRLVLIATFIIGILSTAKAGSRSPIVVFLGVMTFYAIAKIGFTRGVIFFASLGIGLFLFIDEVAKLLQSSGSNIAQRLANAIIQHDTSGRDIIYANVLSIISHSPILGAYYLVPSGFGMGMYPHNFYLEVFMATGILGGIPFIILIFVTLDISFRILRLKHPTGWIILIYLQTLIFGFFSSGLYSSQELWILMFFILTIDIKEKENEFFQKTIPLLG